MGGNCSAAVWMWGTGLLLKLHLTVAVFHRPREQGFARGRMEKCLLRPGEWGSWPASYRTIKTLHVLHWDSRNMEIPNQP